MKTAYPYQVIDSDRLASSDDPALGLASDPGTGKTYTSLLAAHKLDKRRILVVCPAVARPVWEAEVNDFGAWAPRRVDGGRALAPIYDGVVVIVGYEHLIAAERVRDWLEQQRFDLMILDEAHYLKNPASKRTHYVYDVLYRRVDGPTWPLSGTFMLNHPGELFPHINALDPERINYQNYFEFTRTYCRYAMKRVGRTTIEKIVGSVKSKAPELKDRLEGMFVKRPASVNDLPPLNFVTRPVEANLRDPALRSLLAQDNDDAEIMRACMAAPDPLAALKAADVNLARLRSAMAMAKVSAATDIIKDIVENSNDKVLLWVWHMAPFDQLLENLKALKPVSIRGSTTSKKREEAVTKFQNDPATRVFIGQIQAAGTAITLTKATREIFLEQAFTPALNLQAAKRAHRIGQTRSVLVETLYTPDSVDEPVMKLLNGKLADINDLEGVI